MVVGLRAVELRRPLQWSNSDQHTVALSITRWQSDSWALLAGISCGSLPVVFADDLRPASQLEPFHLNVHNRGHNTRCMTQLKVIGKGLCKLELRSSTLLLKATGTLVGDVWLYSIILPLELELATAEWTILSYHKRYRIVVGNSFRKGTHSNLKIWRLSQATESSNI